MGGLACVIKTGYEAPTSALKTGRGPLRTKIAENGTFKFTCNGRSTGPISMLFGSLNAESFKEEVGKFSCFGVSD